MNILLTNRELCNLGGSETWVVTMYEELVKEHDVDIFTVGQDNILFYEDRYSENKHYDLAIINHRECLEFLRDKKNIDKKIFTCHGVLPLPEQPVEGADVYVGVSEETMENIKQKGFPCSTIIRNPINTELFKEEEELNETLENILYISNTHKSLDVIEKAAEGYNFEVIGAGKSQRNVEDYINSADIVITLGRGCYESLACNRNVIILDNGKGDGFVTPESILEFRKNNCSGRRNNVIFTTDTLREEFKKYNPELKMRDYILENNNVSLIANRYLKLI